MKEIATLKLIGAPDRTIVGLIVQQSLAMGAIGFLFGAVFITRSRTTFRAGCCCRARMPWRSAPS